MTEDPRAGPVQQPGLGLYAAPRAGLYAAWHAFGAEEAVAELASNPMEGLSAEEAAKRLEREGPNELLEKPPTPFIVLLLSQFANFLVILLVIAAGISMFLGEWADAAAIVLIIVLNAALGVVQESKAEQALSALKKIASPTARVVRGGVTKDIPAREVVPGDVVLLEAGGYVPADVRLLESVNLRIDEASLTGESVPVEKNAASAAAENAPLGDRACMAFSGTAVSFGRGKGLAVETGMRTQIGLIARMLQEGGKEETPLQKKLSQMGRWLGIAALAICGGVFLLGVLKGEEILSMFMTSVSLAIAAVPEGLPAIVTVCLALGMREMISRHALIRKLPAVETLGSATTICTDKTGTLTENEMTAGSLYADGESFEITGEGYRPHGEIRKGGERAELRDYASVRQLLQAAMLASDARLEMTDSGGEKRWHMVGDPTEGALVVAAAKAGLHRRAVEAVFPRVAEIPFDSERKLMTTIHSVPPLPGRSKDAAAMDPGTPHVAFVKGAPDLIAARCAKILLGGVIRPFGEDEFSAVADVIKEQSSRALRLLGVAYKPLEDLPASPTPEEVERDLVLLGLIGMRDPARAEAAPAVETARRAGLNVIMVTGDYKETAAAIAREIGLIGEGDEVLSGGEIDQRSEEELADSLERVRVFARVSPQHKVRIVDSLKRKGHVVGMTGDGVNDAPALKRADIGIAMGITGTDVAKETADMVLTDDNFSSIVSAVEQGRIIFSNIRKFVYYLLSSNLGEVGTVLVGTLLGWPLPLTAIQLLWTNLITDGAPALALGLEKGEPDVMTKPPRPKKEPIITGPMLGSLAVQAVAITFSSLFAFWLGWRLLGSVEAGRTMAFVTLSGCQLVRAYTCRSERASLFSIPIFGNPWMQVAFLSSMLLLAVVIYVPFVNSVFGVVPLEARALGWAVPLLLFPAVCDEIYKIFLRAAAVKARR